MAKRIERGEMQFRMARNSKNGRFWLGFAVFGAFAVTLAVGWWLDHRAQSVEVASLTSQLEQALRRGSDEDLRAENADLRLLFDEVYTLLKEAGFHVQLDLVVDKNGHYRMRADSAKITDELEAALQALNEKLNQAAPGAP